MEYAPGAVCTLVKKLGQLLLDEYNLQKGAKKDIEYLSRELESISEALRIVREEPPAPHNKQMRIWADEARELSYDMEDIVDSFLVRVRGPEPASKRSTKRFIKKMVKKVTEATARHDIAQEIKDIKERVKEVAERRDRYKVGSFSPHQEKDPRTATMCTRDTNLVGIDGAREELIFKLTKGDDMSAQKPRILSIVGFGGLGKSTLAREVYEKLKVHFDCTAFVSVSRNPDTKKVLKDILYELNRGMYRDIQSKMWDDKQLIEEVQGFLKNKRYFIVIDDMWELASWETIKSALDDNNCGSRVITTTRNVDVAIVAGETYKMLPLSYSNSKKLFFMRIFGDKRKCLDYQSDEISDKFLKKCDGIPLAIITAASLLVGKPKEIWSELYRDIGFGHKDNLQVENTRKILSFSYYDMPSHLKTCLLYLSAFPEDYVISKDPLIWKWIAEGFVIPPDDDETGIGLFELGEQYFNNLANRNMIQTVESEVDGIIDGCRVHDMVLELIRDLSVKENFITILDNGEGTFLPKKKKVHRLAFQKSTMEHISPESYHVDLPNVRSYIASMCISNQKGKFFSFGLLRVLAIEYCQIQEDCNFDDLCNLDHLRYLSVGGTNMPRLPKQIGNLKFLETLDFKESSVEELPSSIVRLTKLVCLCCGWDIMEVPDGIIRNLTSLQQLSITFDWKHDVNHIRRFVKELGSLTELRLLKFSFCNYMDEIIERDLVESLCNLQKIQHLEISYFFDTINADIAKWEAASIVLPGHLRHLFLSRIMFPRLPSCIDLSRLHHLSYLALYVVTLADQDLKLLSRLTELRYLQLVGMEATVRVNEINDTDGDCFFPNLSWFMLEGAMVHFEQNEDSSSFSFHIWNGVDPMPFGSRRYQGSASVPFTLMPNLECLRTSVFPLALKDGNSDCSNIGLEYLTSLRKVRVDILCQRESPADVEEAENALKSAINAHPNCPTLQVQRWQYGPASSVQDQELEEVYLPMEENEDDQEEVVMRAAEAGIFKLSFPSP